MHLLCPKAESGRESAQAAGAICKRNRSRIYSRRSTKGWKHENQTQTRDGGRAEDLAQGRDRVLGKAHVDVRGEIQPLVGPADGEAVC